jgi:hypothetical protein
VSAIRRLVQKLMPPSMAQFCAGEPSQSELNISLACLPLFTHICTPEFFLTLLAPTQVNHIGRYLGP